MDDHNSLRQHPCPYKGPMGRDDLHPVITSTHWTRRKACQSTHERHTLLDCHKSLYHWNTNGNLINISGKRYNQPHSSLHQTRAPPPPHQQLGKGSKYTYRHLTHTKVQKNSCLQVTLYSNIVLPILIWASEALWQAPHRWPIFLPFTITFSGSGWYRTTQFWTGILTDDLKHYQFGIVCGKRNWKLSLAHNTRALFHSTCKSGWSPMLTKILLHWLYKFSHLQPLWKSLPGRIKRWCSSCNRKVIALRSIGTMRGTVTRGDPAP